jgi:phospholipase C
MWRDPRTGKSSLQPACIPDPDLDPVEHPNGGAYRATSVRHIPTIMDAIESRHGLSWRLYVHHPTWGGWAICPSFAGCLYTNQSRKVKRSSAVIADAQEGRLPSLAIVTPSPASSQHNGDSLTKGDNWIGQVVGAIMNGPDWDSTAIFVFWDEWGGFYDHVAPPQRGNISFGFRVPLIVISPYTRVGAGTRGGFVSHTFFAFESLIRFVDANWALPPLNPRVARANDMMNLFDFDAPPRPRLTLKTRACTPLTPAQRHLRASRDPE